MKRVGLQQAFQQRMHGLARARKKVWRRLVLSLGLALVVALPAHATTFVLMDFDGNPAFPNINFGANTAGLAPFTGSAFGLSAASLAAVESTILTKVAADYAPYNISFVTDTTGLASWFTWGIDDRAFVAPNVFKTAPGTYDPINPALPCPPANAGCFRLFGKKGNNLGDVDRTGASIGFPTFTRTYAGSFALGAGSADPSSPSLFGHTDAEIGQALANSAAHEISHMFGVGHPAACAEPCFNLMWVNVESLESTRDKSFTAGDQAILLAALGLAGGDGTRVPEPATLGLLGIGLFALFALKRFGRRLAV